MCDGAGRYDDINTDTVINYVTKLFPEETCLMADPGFWEKGPEKMFSCKEPSSLRTDFIIFILH